MTTAPIRSAVVVGRSRIGAGGAVSGTDCVVGVERRDRMTGDGGGVGGVDVGVGADGRERTCGWAGTKSGNDYKITGNITPGTSISGSDFTPSGNPVPFEFDATCTRG
jgi:hypothetical protein